MKKIYLLLVMVAVANVGWGQVTIAIQDFDAGTSMTFSNTNGSTQVGNSAAGDRPASSTFYSNASTAWKANNETSTLIFSNVSGLGSYTSKYYEFRLSSWSISSTGNGADAGDIVTVAISLDGGATYSNEVRVLGNSNAYWHYSTGVGLASVTYDGNNTPTDFAPAAGGNRTTDGYSTVRVNLDNAATQARLRITLLNNSANEYWTIDEVKLVGTSSVTPTITASATSLTSFGPVVAGNNSAERTYTVEGTNLTANLDVTAPAGVEVSFTSGSYTGITGNTISLTPSSGTVSTTNIYARFSPATATGFLNADITNASTGATTRNVNVQGFAVVAEPTLQSSISFVSSTTTTMDLSLSGGNGTARLVVAKAGSAVNADPSDGPTYLDGGSIFGAGTDLGSGNFVVYDGTNTSISVTGLTAGTTYHFAVYSYNSSGVGTSNYLTPAGTTSGSTAAPPITTYTWTGGNGAWTTASNWTPTRTTPDVTDILQFNDGTTVTVTAVPAQTIGKLSVTNNTTVNLQAGAANTLTIAGGTGTDLDVATGSLLVLDGSNAITLNIATAATASISGAMTVQGGQHLFTAADASGITFNTGGTFTTGTGFSSPASTGPFGSQATGVNNSVVFASGSSFIQNAGSNPFQKTAPASIVVFQTGSLFKAQQNAALSVSGRTYANLEINLAAFSQNQTGGTAMNVDNLTITDGTLNLNLTGGVNIRGNISVAAGETLTFTPASASTVTFNGTSNQSITNNGTLTFGNNASVLISKSSGNVILNTNAQLNNLTISASNTLDLNGQTLSITGFMNNGGALVANNGTVDFTGTSGTQNLTSGGTGTGKTFYNLTHSGASTLQLQANSLRIINNFINNAGPFDANGLNVTVGGNFSSDGTYNAGSGALTFDGASAQSWGGAIASNYGDVVINKSAGSVTAGNNLQANNLTLTSGKVVLGSNNLTVTVGLSGGSSSSFVVTNGTGTLTINNITAAAKAFPVGNSTYNPLTIANGSGHNWTVRVEDAVNNVAAPFNTNKAVLRTWHITPSVNPPSVGADITFQYDDSDPSQLGTSFSTAEDVQLWHYGIAWTASSGAITPTGTAGGVRTITRTGLTRFSPYAIANISGPLPVTFISFSGYKDGNRNQLRWTTATEINNAGFDVQRSADGINYVSVGFVNSLAPGGNSSDAITYSFTDNAPAGTKQFYRLRQVDIGGAAKLSNVVLIRGGKPNSVAIDGLFPNPALQYVNVLIAAPGKDNITLIVTDMAGRIVTRRIVNVEAGSNTVPVDISRLNSGSYLVRIICSEGCDAGTGKFVKQ